MNFPDINKHKFTVLERSRVVSFVFPVTLFRGISCCHDRSASVFTVKASELTSAAAAGVVDEEGNISSVRAPTTSRQRFSFFECKGLMNIYMSMLTSKLSLSCSLTFRSLCVCGLKLLVYEGLSWFGTGSRCYMTTHTLATILVALAAHCGIHTHSLVLSLSLSIYIYI